MKISSLISNIQVDNNKYKINMYLLTYHMQMKDNQYLKFIIVVSMIYGLHTIKKNICTIT